MGNAPPELEPFKKKLTVLSVKEIHRGRGAKGEWVMYEVEALDESGKRVDQAAGGVPLRTFDGGLRLNELVEYEVQPKDTDRHGRTYTLKAQRPPTWQLINELTERVNQLEARLQRLENGQNPGSQSGDTAPSEVPAAAPPAQTQTW